MLLVDGPAWIVTIVFILGGTVLLVSLYALLKRIPRLSRPLWGTQAKPAATGTNAEEGDLSGLAGCVVLPLILPLLLIVVPPFLALCAWGMARDRKALLRRMQAAGRYRPDIDTASAGGTLLEVWRTEGWGKPDLWWTPDDVRALHPALVDSDYLERDFYRALEQVVAQYLEGESGSAVLVGFGRGDITPSTLVVLPYLARMEHRLDDEEGEE